MNNSSRQVVKWFSQPSSWLSIIAAILSVITFFLVYAYKGDVRVILPDKIGIGLEKGDLSIILPLVLTNTGAPRTVIHIIQITASIEGIAPLQEPPNEVDVRWRAEVKFVNEEEYMQDHIEPINRAVPFALFGGTSTQRVFELVQIGRGFSKSNIDGFTITVNVITDAGNYNSTASHYDCDHIKMINNSIEYCPLTLPQ